MKKAKIFLSAFALVAVLGASFAFKSASRSTVTFYTTDEFEAIAPEANAVLKATTTTTTIVPLKYYTTIPNTPAIVQGRVTTSAL